MNRSKMVGSDGPLPNMAAQRSAPIFMLDRMFGAGLRGALGIPTEPKVCPECKKEHTGKQRCCSAECYKVFKERTKRRV